MPFCPVLPHRRGFFGQTNLPPDTKIKPTFHHLQVLKPTHGQELRDYFLFFPLRSHGLTPKKLKLLMYSYAVFNGIPVPPAWVQKKSAGKDWFTSFLEWNKKLSIRKPKATSQTNAAAWNKVVMNNFYDQVFRLIFYNSFFFYLIFEICCRWMSNMRSTSLIQIQFSIQMRRITQL